MRDTIFQSNATMAGGHLTEIDTPVRVNQVPREGSKSGAQSNMKLTEDMNVANCCRPRRGHDY